jgi:hypothetical protein
VQDEKLTNFSGPLETTVPSSAKWGAHTAPRNRGAGADQRRLLGASDGADSIQKKKKKRKKKQNPERYLYTPAAGGFTASCRWPGLRRAPNTGRLPPEPKNSIGAAVAGELDGHRKWLTSDMSERARWSIKLESTRAGDAGLHDFRGQSLRF